MRLTAVLLALLLISPAWAGVVVQHDATTGNNGNGTAVSVSHTSGTNPSLVICGFAIPASTVSGTPTYGGVNMTGITNASPLADGGNNKKIYLYQLRNPLSGAQSFSATIAATKNWAAACTTFLSSGTSPLNAVQTQNNGTSSTGVTVTSTTSHMVYDFMMVNGTLPTATLTGSTETQRSNQTNGGVVGASATAPGAASVTTGWTCGGTLPTCMSAALDILGTRITPQE